jgi:peroxiredoxin Q/BCP
MTTLKGDKAPAFSALDQDGKLHQLADAGKKLVVFFYQKQIRRDVLRSV